MALPFAAISILLGLGPVSLLEGTVDPTAGGGVAAQIGSFYLRTGTAQAWLKIGAGNTQWALFETASAAGRQTFRYVATGAEGSDFIINLPATRPDVNYNAVVNGGGLANLLDFETVAADNTTTQIHVISSGVLTAADVLLVTVDQLT